MILKLYRLYAQQFKSFKNKNELNQHIQLHVQAAGKKLSKNYRAILDMIAKHSVKITGVSWLKEKTIAQQIGVHVRTVQRAIQRMVQLNILRIEIVEVNGIELCYFVINPFSLPEDCHDFVENLSNDKIQEKPVTSRDEDDFCKNETIETNETDESKYIRSNECNDIPEKLAQFCLSYFGSEKTNEIYRRVQIAARSVKLSLPIEQYIDTVICCLKKTIWTEKMGRIRKTFLGYFYRLLEYEFCVLKRQQSGFGYNWLEN